jgi:hypothetical protein
MADPIILGLGDQTYPADSAPDLTEILTILGDLELLEPGVPGGNDTIIGGSSNIERLIGDGKEVYAVGGRDTLEARGVYTELIGDAATLKPFATGGDDVLSSSAGAGRRTLMYGDAVQVQGAVTCGNDVFLSGASDDVIYGDYEFELPADLANDPFLFEIFGQQVNLNPTVAPQSFSYTPVTPTLINQTNTQLAGGDPPPEDLNGTRFTIATGRGLVEVYDLIYGDIPDEFTFEFDPPEIQPPGGENGETPAPAPIPDIDFESALEEFREIQELISPDPNFEESTIPTELTYVIPDATNGDPTRPRGGADRFVYDSFDEGNDVIADFRPGQDGDRLVFQNGLTLADQGGRLEIFENDFDTLIRFGDGGVSSTIRLVDFTGLSADHILFQPDGGELGIGPLGGFQPVTI